eukprot:scaffold119936_cov20-Tisochrysis_lutea.AAC.2
MRVLVLIIRALQLTADSQSIRTATPAPRAAAALLFMLIPARHVIRGLVVLPSNVWRSCARGQGPAQIRGHTLVAGLQSGGCTGAGTYMGVRSMCEEALVGPCMCLGTRTLEGTGQAIHRCRGHTCSWIVNWWEEIQVGGAGAEMCKK